MLHACASHPIRGQVCMFVRILPVSPFHSSQFANYQPPSSHVKRLFHRKHNDGSGKCPVDQHKLARHFLVWPFSWTAKIGTNPYSCPYHIPDFSLTIISLTTSSLTSHFADSSFHWRVDSLTDRQTDRQTW